MAKTWPFLVKMAPDFVLQLSLPKMGHFHFLTKKNHSQTKLLVSYCDFAKTPFFYFGGHLRSPPNRFFPQKMSQKLC